MLSAEVLDRRYDEVVAKYPRGLSKQQFWRIALESADEDGRIYPHPVRDFFVMHSLLHEMWFARLIEPGWTGRNQPMWYRITDAGRDWLVQNPE